MCLALERAIRGPNSHIPDGLTRDVWDVDDDQLCEALEALQIEITWREWVTSPAGLPQGNLRAPQSSDEGVHNDGEVDPRQEGGWKYGRLLQ